MQLGAVVAVDGAFGPKGSPGELNEWLVLKFFLAFDQQPIAPSILSTSLQCLQLVFPLLAPSSSLHFSCRCNSRIKSSWKYLALLWQSTASCLKTGSTWFPWLGAWRWRWWSGQQTHVCLKLGAYPTVFSFGAWATQATSGTKLFVKQPALNNHWEWLFFCWPIEAWMKVRSATGMHLRQWVAESATSEPRYCPDEPKKKQASAMLQCCVPIRPAVSYWILSGSHGLPPYRVATTARTDKSWQSSNALVSPLRHSKLWGNQMVLVLHLKYTDFSCFLLLKFSLLQYPIERVCCPWLSAMPWWWNIMKYQWNI